jgi:hypothetical protein
MIIELILVSVEFFGLAARYQNTQFVTTIQVRV